MNSATYNLRDPAGLEPLQPRPTADVGEIIWIFDTHLGLFQDLRKTEVLNFRGV